MDKVGDLRVLRDLAKRYAEVAAAPIMYERRDLWARHNSLKPTRPPVLATFGSWNVWCREVFGDDTMECADPFLRGHERSLRMALFAHGIGDDRVLEPWITQHAVVVNPPEGLWGVREGRVASGVEGGAWGFDPPIRTWHDVGRLVSPHHVVDEAATGRRVARLIDAVGDILAVNVDRGPAYQGFWADISTNIARLRGLEQLMIDMIESPRELHGLLAFMRDGILTAQHEAEDAGDYSLTTQQNQSETYCEELERPRANSGPRKRGQLWGYCAAQEFTLISPAMHDEFMLQYQRPIIEKSALCAYGCCEDLTHKIDRLRQVRNLRTIAVSPRADIARCAEQIGTDYVFSWRPNPAEMVCCGFDEGRIRHIIGSGLQAARGCRVHLHLKDIETVEGEPDRLKRWVDIVRDVGDHDA